MHTETNRHRGTTSNWRTSSTNTARYFERFQEAGWDAYIVTVEFGALRGTERQRVMAMARAVARFYGAVSKKLVGTSWPKGDLAGYQPVGAFFPHLAPLAYGGEVRTTVKPESCSDELHMRGVLIANRWKKLRITLDKHVAKNPDHYVTGKIRDIHVARLKDVDEAVEYFLDGLRERIFIPDDIMILDLADSPSLRPSASPDFDACSGYDGPAVFPVSCDRSEPNWDR
jgi:hypothetical protein